MRKVITFLIVILVSGCAARTEQTAKNSVQIFNAAKLAEDNLKKANILAKSGRYLEAGIYYEAALAGLGREREILPLLIAAQIRSKRLIAARKNLAWLFRLTKPTYELEELAILLDNFLHTGDETLMDKGSLQ